MLKPMQITNINTDQWIELFQYAIASSDTQKIHLLLHSLPIFRTEEEMRNVLLLSMEAESILCTLRQELLNKRANITAHFPSL
jgi:hypothetical protein